MTARVLGAPEDLQVETTEANNDHDSAWELQRDGRIGQFKYVGNGKHQHVQQ